MLVSIFILKNISTVIQEHVWYYNQLVNHWIRLLRIYFKSKMKQARRFAFNFKLCKPWISFQLFQLSCQWQINIKKKSIFLLLTTSILNFCLNLLLDYYPETVFEQISGILFGVMCMVVLVVCVLCVMRKKRWMTKPVSCKLIFLINFMRIYMIRLLLIWRLMCQTTVLIFFTWMI